MANLSLHRQGKRVRRNCSSLLLHRQGKCVLAGGLLLLNLLLDGLQARLGLLLLLLLGLLLLLLLGLLLLGLLDIRLGSLSVGSKNTSTMVTSDVVGLAVIFKLV